MCRWVVDFHSKALRQINSKPFLPWTIKLLHPSNMFRICLAIEHIVFRKFFCYVEQNETLFRASSCSPNYAFIHYQAGIPKMRDFLRFWRVRNANGDLFSNYFGLFARWARLAPLADKLLLPGKLFREKRNVNVSNWIF